MWRCNIFGVIWSHGNGIMDTCHDYSYWITTTRFFRSLKLAGTADDNNGLVVMIMMMMNCFGRRVDQQKSCLMVWYSHYHKPPTRCGTQSYANPQTRLRHAAVLTWSYFVVFLPYNYFNKSTFGIRAPLGLPAF